MIQLHFTMSELLKSDIAEKYNIKINKSKFNSLYGTGIINNEKIIFNDLVIHSS